MINNKKNNIIGITYHEILREAGKQINSRKKTIAWRSFFIKWPAMIAFLLIFYFENLGGKELLEKHQERFRKRRTIGRRPI